MSSKLLPLAVAAAAPLWTVSVAAQAQQPLNLTWTCQFTSGPRAGSTVDFSAARGSPLVPVGARCGDMAGSNGVAVVPPKAPRLPGQGRFYRSPGAPEVMTPYGRPKPGYTQSCRFTSGPRAGGAGDFAGVLGAIPIQIGAACSDGTSNGVGVASGPAGP